MLLRVLLQIYKKTYVDIDVTEAYGTMVIVVTVAAATSLLLRLRYMKLLRLRAEKMRRDPVVIFIILLQAQEL